MSNSMDEMLIAPNAKRGRRSNERKMLPNAKRERKRGRNSSETENHHEDNKDKDRLNDLPDCILLHILSFVSTKHAVQTCMLSKRSKDLWKHLPNLILHSGDFLTFEGFTKFVSWFLIVRGGLTPLRSLDFVHNGRIQSHLLKRIIKYAFSHNVRRLGLSVTCGFEHLPPCLFSSQTLTSLKLSDCSKNSSFNKKKLFPKSLNLPALTALHIENFALSPNGNGCRAEPFSGFRRLNSLIIDNCSLSDANILCISSATLTDLAVLNYYSEGLDTMELSSPNLHSLNLKGTLCLLPHGSNLSSVEQLNIHAILWSRDTDPAQPPKVLLSWLQELANIKSLTVSASTLQDLFLYPHILKHKLPILGSLESLKVKDIGGDKLFSSTPNGIVDFLLQNSPSAKVDIIRCSR